MAFNVIPKTTEEIGRSDVAGLFSYIIKQYPVIKTIGPIALDSQFPTLVKIHRSLETEGLDLTRLPIDVSKLKLDFGNGTRQAGGINLGILFEHKLETAFNQFIDEGMDGIKDINMQKFI